MQCWCAEESEQQSPHSPVPPGIVLDEECIGRFVISPEHIDTTTGEIKPSAFPRDELVAGTLSITRLQHATEDELEKHANKIASRKKERNYEGLIVATTSDVRVIVCEEVLDKSDNEKDLHVCIRQFCVVDDGLTDFKSHALIKKNGLKSKAKVRAARVKLFRAFSSTVFSSGNAISWTP